MYQNTRSKRLGSLIKRIRKRRGLTALELAHKVGVTENAVRKLESGHSKQPRLSTALRLMHVLNIPSLVFPGRDARRTYDEPELAAVIKTLRIHKPTLQDRGVRHIRIFGSVARGDTHALSDVDLVVEPVNEKFSLFDLAGVQQILQRVFEKKVDVITEGALRRSAFRQAIEEEAVLAF